MYNLTFRGEKYPIPAALFFTIAAALITIFVCSLIGIYKFGGWMLLLVLVILTLEVKIDGRIYGLITNNTLRRVVSTICLWSGFAYFVYGKIFM